MRTKVLPSNVMEDGNADDTKIEVITDGM